MRYLALATDYDGTLAKDGEVSTTTVAALERLRGTGRRLIMVTGRELADLTRVFPRLDLFDRVVAENGAVLANPGTGASRVLAAPPPPGFVERLRARGVDPISIGRAIVATLEPFEDVVQETIEALGLDLQVIPNKGSLMVLPDGVNKASGLQVALDELELSSHNVVGVGDAENDHAFLAICECAVAVANALPELKERADWVTEGSRGDGVAELADGLVRDDLAALAPLLGRHDAVLGQLEDASPFRLPAYGGTLCVAGESPSRRAAVLETLLGGWLERRYQVCVLDAEEQPLQVEGAIAMGASNSSLSVDAVLHALCPPRASAVARLGALRPHDRRLFLSRLLERLVRLGADVGRPHWLVLREGQAPDAVAGDLPGLCEIPGVLVSVARSSLLSPAILRRVDIAFSVGATSSESFRPIAEAKGRRVPKWPGGELPERQLVAWLPDREAAPFGLQLGPARHRPDEVAASPDRRGAASGSDV